MISKDIIEIANEGNLFPAYNVTGMFFRYNSKTKHIGTLYTCREELAHNWKSGCNYLGFTTTKNFNWDLLNKHFEEIENKLGIEKHTILYPIKKYKNYVVFQLNPFWTQNAVNRSVCSLLVRMLIAYQAKHMETMIDSYPLSKQCKHALNRFLDGYTKFIGKMRGGFVYTFAYYYDSHGLANAVLIKP